jgi:2-polyprenyl-3-methyl-5-hydroxy-6-metoxy-1,4-benzoquinol methylase
MVQYLTKEEIEKNKDMLKEVFLSSASASVKDKYVYDFIDKNINLESNVLDIGCGGGDLLKKLKNSGYKNIYGFDIGNYVKFADIADLIKIGDLNFEKIPFAENNFELITALNMLEHLENPLHFERECARLLKPKGFLILSIPNGQNLWSRMSYFASNNITAYDAYNNHICFLTADIFKKIFLKDFELVETVYRKGFMPYFPKLKLPATKLFSKSVCYFLKKK